MALTFPKILAGVAAAAAILTPTLLAADSAVRTVMRREQPRYPELARRMHVCGTIVLSVTVRPDGSVEGATTLSGHPLLVDAAMESVKRWKFAPAPETQVMNISVVFNLP